MTTFHPHHSDASPAPRIAPPERNTLRFVNALASGSRSTVNYLTTPEHRD